MPLVASAPPANVVILIPSLSVRTPANTDRRNVDPIASDITIAVGKETQYSQFYTLINSENLATTGNDFTQNICSASMEFPNFKKLYSIKNSHFSKYLPWFYGSFAAYSLFYKAHPIDAHSKS